MIISPFAVVADREDSDVIFLGCAGGERVHGAYDPLDHDIRWLRAVLGNDCGETGVREQLSGTIDRLRDAVREQQEHVTGNELDGPLFVRGVLQDAEGDAALGGNE